MWRVTTITSLSCVLSNRHKTKSILSYTSCVSRLTGYSHSSKLP
jgi:hypothetical protein